MYIYKYIFTNIYLQIYIFANIFTNPIFTNIDTKIVNPHVWSNNFEIIGRNYGNPIKIKFSEVLKINEN